MDSTHDHRPPPLRLRNATLLIVEPNEIAQDHYRSALKPLGCSMIQVTNAASAMAIARRSAFHLVITELMLPDASGLDILNGFDADEALKSIPIVAVSSSAAIDQLAPAAAVEFADCILKPIDALRLRGVVQRILG